MRIGIIGLGAWGVCALERVVTRLRGGGVTSGPVTVHIIEPGIPGSGIYDTTQPDCLRLNNPCGELSLFPFSLETDRPAYAVSLFDWATAAGYRWVGYECRRDPAGVALNAHDFLPRRLMGEYLQWFYRTLLTQAVGRLEIVHHAARAVDLRPRGGAELILLDNGRELTVDHVIVTLGHVANRRDAAGAGVRHRAPFPIGLYTGAVTPQTTVGVIGFGLVAVDVVTALTTGLGGRFGESSGAGGLVYRPSGREPHIHLFSRSGLPFTAKSVTGVDRSDVYVPAVCTPEALAALSRDGQGGRRLVDLRSEMLPLLFAEMYARYYAQVAYWRDGLETARAVRAQVAAAVSAHRFDRTVEDLRSRYGHYDAEDHFFGRQIKNGSGADYQADIHQMLADDLAAARVPDGRSPVKAAAEVFRIFRDPVREVVEHGGLSLESYLDFNGDVASRIKRLVAGPPALRNSEFMALLDAGVLEIDLGAAPALAPSPERGPEGTEIASTMLERPRTVSADMMVLAHLDEPRIGSSESPLLQRMYAAGRISQFRYGAVTVGSVDLTRDDHPIDARGHVQTRIWMFGVLTEGIRHFTHYVPSPRSRVRAVHDIGACVESILG